MKTQVLSFFFATLIVMASVQINAQVSINTDGSQPDGSAMFDVKSTVKGMLPPRMTLSQMNAIQNPANGLVVFCTDCGQNSSGALALFMSGAWWSLTASCINPLAPSAGTHVPSANQIVWNWNAVPNATGYKWNTTNNYATATDMGTNITTTETGLACVTSYTRYVWAYSSCGVSPASILTQSTTGSLVASPAAGVHVPSLNQIVWKWLAVSGATGYKWNTVNDYSTATDMGPGLLIVETGMTCNTLYNRYVWAYNDCGNSAATTLTQSTLSTAINAPTSGTHVPGPTQIVWNWNTVSGATGYKWNTTNSFATATDMGNTTTKTETGLTCNTPYTRYVWAYSACGVSTALTVSQSTTGSTVTAPVSGTHVPSPTQIVWNWNTVSGATGYKWSATNNYATATDMGLNLSFTETGLTCLTQYTRYIWAYNACGYSSATILTQSTTGSTVTAPVAGTQVPSATQIVWNWNTVAGAAGYKWNTTNNYATATDMGTATTRTETSLTCNTAYSRYVWAYNLCGVSAATTLTQTTSLNPPATPAAGTHVPSPTQIDWNWNTVSGATGYKWNTTNNFATATDMGAATSKTETGLTCNTAFTRYAWAYNSCGNSTAVTLAQSTTVTPTIPTAGTHVPSATQIVWNWNPVSGATGYKWSNTPSYSGATDMGTSTTKTETGLVCITTYTRYIWAYSSCGYSAIGTMSQTTTTDPPASPVAGTHTATIIQITWRWNTVSGATGYKWNTTNNYATSTDMGTATSTTETGLTCGTNYTRYVWAYRACGVSLSTILIQTTISSVPVPSEGVHAMGANQITWNWTTVTGATGYKWNTINDYASALDMGSTNSKHETGLSPGTSYTRFVWAYNTCGISSSLTITGQTCGGSFTINHIAGSVAPVNKSVTYGTVSNVPGAVNKCWITSNLGSDHQATAVNDATEASAGWYWQFNRKQGYKHDGTTRTPNTTWTSIHESSDWVATNDPCTIDLGNGWRIPTSSEWTNVDASGGWTDWNGPWNSSLKMHAAGYLENGYGYLIDRGGHGKYWSSEQESLSYGNYLSFTSSYCGWAWETKASCFTLRCLHD